MRSRCLAFSLLLQLTYCLHGGFAVESISSLTSETPVTDSSNGTRYLRASKVDVKIDGQLPTVFIIGSQKGGALSLLDLMTHHPLLCGGVRKEPEFFSVDENYEAGTKSYKDLFRDGKCNKNAKYSKYIDGTPMLHIPKVMSRIVDTYSKDKDGKKLKDNLKFIVLLREPVSRDFVWYQHNLRNELHKGQMFKDVKTIKEMTDESHFRDENGIDTRYGRYIEQLQEFTKHFRRDQLLVLNSQVIFDDAPSIMKNVYQFIGVPDETVANQVLPRVNHFLETGMAFETCTIHHIPEMDCSYRDALGEYYEPYNEQLYYWIKATKNEANVNEPPFVPVFSSYKLTSCSEDARKEYDAYLSKERETILLREEFQTKTNSFHMPEGACHSAPRTKEERQEAREEEFEEEKAKKGQQKKPQL